MEAANVSYLPPGWMADHVFKLPADARAQHARAMAAPTLHDHEVSWVSLRRAQAEDEERVKNGHKKRMRWLTATKHINRTSFSALSVDAAMAVLNMSTADQLRLRRRGWWR